MYVKKNYVKKINRTRSGISKVNDNKAFFLDRNEKIVEYDKYTLNKIQKKISKLNLGHYPDLDLFYKELSKWLRISSDNLFLTDGVSGAIKNLLEVYTDPYKNNEVIYISPSFALYSVFTDLYNVKAKLVEYNKNYDVEEKSIFKKINKKTSIIFLQFPNMPIEGNISKNFIEKIANICDKKKIILAIDEVYFPFSNESCINLIKKFKNIVIMRSFSKAFGLASIRLGYMCANKEVIDYVSKFRSGYETNTLSVSIASVLMSNYGKVLENVKIIKNGILFLKSNLKKNNIYFTGGNKGNFLFIHLNSEVAAKKIYKELKKNKIYIRIGWPKPFNSGLSVTGAPINIMKIFLRKFLLAYNKFNK